VKLAVGLMLAMLVLAPRAGAADAQSVQPHPGDAISVEGRGNCTLGFLFAGSDRRSYMSTAGHCLVKSDNAGQVWADGTGPIVRTSQGRIGRIAFVEYRVSRETGDNYDFALVRLDRAVRPSSEIRGYGSPTGIYDARSTEPTVLRVYGQGTGVSLIAPAREIVAPHTRHRDHIYAHGALTPGDSGGPVIDIEGRAVGSVLGAGARLGNNHDVQSSSAPNIVGRLSPVLAHAVDRLHIGLRLVLGR
jgi:hypothetical protein